MELGLGGIFAKYLVKNYGKIQVISHLEIAHYFYVPYKIRVHPLPLLVLRAGLE